MHRTAEDAVRRKAFRSRAGQAMVESVIAILAITFAFLCAVEFSDLLRAKLLMRHAAARAARCRAVGMNRYMAEKSARVAMIPASGRRLFPAAGDVGLENVSAAYAARIGDAVPAVLRAPAWSPEAAIELWRIPAYLESRDESYARGVLDYELWDATRIDAGGPVSASPRIRATVGQTRPRITGASALFGAPAADGGGIALSASAEIENHALLYMEDAGL